MTGPFSITSVAPISYPPDLSPTGIRLYLNFARYQKTGVFEEAVTNKITEIIALPIPDNLTENFNILYNDFEAGWISTAFESNRLKLIEENLSNPNNLPPGIMPIPGMPTGGPPSSGVGSLGNFLGRMIRGGIDDAIGPYVDNYYGTAPNPHTTVAFKSPALREHEFTWTFAPKNSSESRLLNAILKKLKQHLSPTVHKDNRFFLNYPDLCLPEFVNSSPENFLYNFKPCVITGFTVNNTAGGRPAFFNDTASFAPVIISMTIHLKEIELFLNDDVAKTQEQIYSGKKSGFNTSSTGTPVNISGSPSVIYGGSIGTVTSIAGDFTTSSTTTDDLLVLNPNLLSINLINPISTTPGGGPTPNPISTTPAPILPAMPNELFAIFAKLQFSEIGGVFYPINSNVFYAALAAYGISSLILDLTLIRNWQQMHILKTKSPGIADAYLVSRWNLAMRPQYSIDPKVYSYVYTGSILGFP
jgi:hypothetical protein